MIKFTLGSKLTLKTENLESLTTQNQVLLQDIKKSFEAAQLDEKIY